jgi:predicted  nucleic acid-binding Zn-ribbon protein
MNQLDTQLSNLREVSHKELYQHLAHDRLRIMEQHTNLKQALDTTPNEAKKEQIMRMFKKTEMILKEIDRKTLEISERTFSGFSTW